MSKIKLLNNQGDEVTIEHSDTTSAQGNSVVNIKDVTKQVDTIADLKALDGSHKLVYVTGYHTKGDGAFGSHFFEWDATSIEADNGGTIIALTSIATGRYKLKYSGAVNVKWFGAIGDGVADDTVAIQNAISILTVYVPAGVYIVTSTLADAVNDLTIFGDGSGVSAGGAKGSLIKSTITTALFDNMNYNYNFKDIGFENTTTNGVCFKAGNGCSVWNFENVDVFKFNKAFETRRSDYLRFTSVTCKNQASIAFDFSDLETDGTISTGGFNGATTGGFNNVIYLEKCRASVTETGFKHVGSDITLVECDSSAVVKPYVFGTATHASKSANMNSCYSEAVSGNSIVSSTNSAVNITGGYFQGGSSSAPVEAFVNATNSRVSVRNITGGDWYKYKAVAVNSTVSGIINVVSNQAPNDFMSDASSDIYKYGNQGVKNYVVNKPSGSDASYVIDKVVYPQATNSLIKVSFCSRTNGTDIYTETWDIGIFSSSQYDIIKNQASTNNTVTYDTDNGNLVLYVASTDSVYGYVSVESITMQGSFAKTLIAI